MKITQDKAVYSNAKSIRRLIPAVAIVGKGKASIPQRECPDVSKFISTIQAALEATRPPFQIFNSLIPYCPEAIWVMARFLGLYLINDKPTPGSASFTMLKCLLESHTSLYGGQTLK